MKVLLYGSPSILPFTSGTGQMQRHLQVPVQLTDIFISPFWNSLQDSQNQGLPQAAGVPTMLIPRRTALKTLFGEQNAQNLPLTKIIPFPFPLSQDLSHPSCWGALIFLLWPRDLPLTASLPLFLLPSFTPSDIACESSPPAQGQNSWGSFKLFFHVLSGRKTNTIRQNYIKLNKLLPW